MSEKEEYKLIMEACSKQEKANTLEQFFGGDKPKYDINSPIPGQSGFTPLGFAAWFNNIDSLLLLTQFGADINKEIGDSKITPLDIACTHKKIALVTMLIRKGSQINHQCSNLITPLMRNCEAGGLDITKAIINKKPNLLLKDKNGLTCLNYAEKFGHSDIQKFIQFSHLSQKIYNTTTNKGKSRSKI